MNNLINKYLQSMDFFVNFNLDEEFNETIKSRHRDTFNYNSFIEGDFEVVPGLHTRVTGAHTRYHQIIQIDSKDDKGVYLADLVPTTSHLKLPYLMAYDLFPHEVLLKKKELLTQAAEEKWRIFFDHDPKAPTGKIFKEKEDVFGIEV